MRPIPEAAQQVSIEQVGDRLRLAWTTPAKNRDGSTENLDLREARVLRRVLDLEALVQAQTRPAVEAKSEPETKPSGTEAPETGAVSGETPAAPESPLPPPPAEASEAGSEPRPGPPPGETTDAAAVPPPSTPGSTPSETGTETQTGTQTGTETQAQTQTQTAAPQTPAPPARPQVAFPPFETEAAVVATLPALEPGAPAHYEEPVDSSWIGKRVEYAVVYANRKKRVSPISARVQIDPMPALAPPAAPNTRVGDGFVALAWPPAAGGSDIGYLVFRRSGAEASPNEGGPSPIPLDEQPLTEPAFEDHGIVFGQSYCYAVAIVRRPPAPPVPEVPAEPGSAAAPLAEIAAGTPAGPGTETVTGTETPAGASPAEAEAAPESEIVPVVPPIANPHRMRSPLSDDVCVTPEDVFPPPVPTGLVAVPTGDGTLLTWRAVDAPDLRGYRVYGGASASSPLTLLGQVETPSYTDRDAPAGEPRFYAVTAIDTAPGTNESQKSEIVSATRPQ